MPQPLSAKESSLFRQVIRNYEDKQYKRGLKAAEQILKKNPKHGDTMAMKALILNQQGKTEEAFALGKEALTADMKSHICWHVYGLLYRHQKNFEEAIKAYKFALRLEPESAQIQRDLALLQAQMRDYQGYIQSRTAMLQARPQVRQNWSALAIAHHLAGDLAQAEKVLTSYEESLKTPPSKTDLEHSEALKYKNYIIAETGDYQRALDHLETIAKSGLDRLYVLERRAEYLYKLGKKEDAAKAYRALLERNPDHAEYYNKLVEVLDLPADDQAAKKAVYDEYATKFPRADAPKRLPLDFLAEDDFEEAADSYLTYMLDRGVPSTFANLKHLYKDANKKETLESLALDYLETKEKESTEKTASSDFKGETAALYFLAQHYNYHPSRDLTKALEYAEKGISLMPKNVEFHMTKARIFKHQGNTQKASEIMDQARNLDLKDRYINSKSVKYMLRNNENEKALKTFALFTRSDSPNGPLAELIDMQCMWFLSEDGEAYVRRGDVALALKRFHTIYNIFDVWQEDQFDFHSFSLRKGQLAAYMDMIRWEDKLREHPIYTRAALDAIALYISMHDGRSATNGVNGSADDEAEAERKKAVKKARKDAQKAERDAAEKASKQDPNKAKAATGEPVKKDDDPYGEKLAATTQPLVEATKFLTPILEHSPKNIDGQIAGFEVYLRREKYVLALGCLNAALALDASNPSVHEQTVRFRTTINTKLDSLPAQVAEVIKSEFKALDTNVDLKQYNTEFLAKHKESALHVIAAARTAKLLGEDTAKAEKALASVLDLESVEHDQALEAYAILRNWRSSEAEPFKAAAHKKWPEVTMFA
ncbi:NMDA receptor-regulated protein 1-domain-containing protein [Microdochium trichocladiopsis]|uniref:NMDA receptor-regulated protein 1-domain-containing protein n=1 Tax=Microdochium trichocladiopsis TaxID=1682393 RepID=A0A9P9BZ22_9PEZI|nr:NMDA receptor-regulated protein 1-domain-containing protein [Microdochium trichocladiopsis]KAH7039659.1 NMDA receptor-regulated protein 1-domain-containing protein [Microdochium trichocladiopsis]